MMVWSSAGRIKEWLSAEEVRNADGPHQRMLRLCWDRVSRSCLPQDACTELHVTVADRALKEIFAKKIISHALRGERDNHPAARRSRCRTAPTRFRLVRQARTPRRSWGLPPRRYC
jgi:hypothetical protein